MSTIPYIFSDEMFYFDKIQGHFGIRSNDSNLQ